MIYDGLITVAPCSRPSRERETDGRRSIVNFLRLKSENVWCKPQSVPFARVDQRPTTTCHLPVVVCTRDSLAHTHTRAHTRAFVRKGKRVPRKFTRHPSDCSTPAHTPRHVVNHASPTTCHSRGETGVVARSLLLFLVKLLTPSQQLSHSTVNSR